MPLPLVTEAGEVIDARGMTVVPGFIDVHVHGGGGYSLLGSDAEQVRAFARWVVRHGVTGFLIGATGPTRDHFAAQIAAGLEAARPRTSGAARILGFHFEGPFLNPARHGAFDPRLLRTPTVAELDELLDAAGRMARLMTIAPELPGAEAVIRHGVERGIVMSMGHTDASLEQARQGFAWGIRHTTHTFNAMRPFGHRDPGAVAAALTDDAITCELIGDMVHVHPAAAQVLLRCKGARNTVLVTDGMQLAGGGEGVFRFGGRPVRIVDGVARLPDGTIAGSISTMDANLRNLVGVGVPLHEAVQMASANAARVCGVDDRLGAIAPGMDADLVVLDEGLQVRMTLVGGEIAFPPSPSPVRR
jgi:N-acetylglucosamine-6-phosphate deacetylase